MKYFPVWPGLVLLLCGCGRAPDSDLRNAERLRNAVALETGSTGTVMQIDHGEIRIRSDGRELALNLSEGQPRPAQLPSDVRLPPGMQIDLWSRDDQAATLSGQLADSPGNTASFFRNRWPAEGWILETDTPTEDMHGLTFRKGFRRVSLTLEADPDQANHTRLLLFSTRLPKETP